MSNRIPVLRTPVVGLILPLAVLAFVASPAFAQNLPLGHLVVVGGGGTPDSVMKETIRLSGGSEAKIVLIASASTRIEAGPELIQFFRKYGATNVEVLKVDDEAVALKQLEDANLIWIGGGSQLRLVKSLVPTIKSKIAELYRGGSVIGGTSAGAAAMSKKMITGQADLKSVRAQTTKLADGLGMTDAIVDQHFHKRQRFNRLLSAVLDNPDLLGIGIDEKTAIIISGSTIKVLGTSSVLILDGSRAGTKETKTGQLHSAMDVKLHVLAAGQQFDVTSMKLVETKNHCQ